MQDDQPVVSKAELLRRLDQGYAAFAALLDGLTDQQMAEPNVGGDWSVKDILAHLIAHEQQALAELRHALRGERMAIDHAGGDRFNAKAVAERRGQSPAEVRAAWEASYRQVVAALDDTIDGALANNTYEHYSEHIPQIEAWLKAKDGGDGAGDLDR